MGIKSGKVWGKTELLIDNPVAEFHRIDINAGGVCSLHRHLYKFNYFYVVSGVLNIEVHKNDYELVDTTVLASGEGTIVKPNEYHRFVAVTDVVAFELYFPELLSSDIERKDVGVSGE
jgi:mannose-6-phosphate isomerase-like protein (cupin superfamily)